MIKTMNIVGRKYRVREVECAVKEDGSVNVGAVDNRVKEIKIDVLADRVEGREILLHEAIHAIADRVGINLSEGKVIALTTGIDLLYAENPGFRELYEVGDA